MAKAHGKGTYDKIPSLEALKEIGRYVLFLVVSWIITGAINYFVEIPQTELTAVLLLILRWLDKWLHYKAKEAAFTKEPIRLTGLSPF